MSKLKSTLLKELKYEIQKEDALIKQLNEEIDAKEKNRILQINQWRKEMLAKYK